ncbi:MAG: pantetheine-phosphate adenylyltransferase [Cytophagaceae bacterium]
MKKAIYAFSGDPITYGHIDVIERASKVFDELIVGIGINPSKKYLFALEERTLLAEKALSKFPNVKVTSFRGLLVDFAYENNIPVIIRGLRNGEDFNFELMLHQIGETQRMNIDTFFLPSRQEMAHISSGAAKALQMEQGLIHEYVPLNVKQKLEERLSGQYIIGITGEIGAGKSYVSEQFKELGLKAGIPVHRIDLDTIGHEILENLSEPVFVKLRETLIEEFGQEIKLENGFINRKALGKIVFSDLSKLERLKSILYKPLLLRLRRSLYGKRGLILLDAALLAESRMAYLCNNKVILVKTSKELQIKRLKQRTYSDEQIHSRIQSQYSYEKKLQFLEKEIEDKGCGVIFHIDNSNENEGNIRSVFEQVISEIKLSEAYVK